VTRPSRLANLAHAVTILAGLAAVSGCYNQQQYDQALQRSAELQQQLDQTKATLATKEADLKGEQTRSAELAAARDKAVRAIEQTSNEARQLRKTLDAARRDLESANASLERERADLQKALTSQKEARTKTEQELADRDREIDVLKSRVRQLERQLDAAKNPAGSRPATQATR
jgi:septal ring factor EnvC (AmiA/AmiB activator)